MKAVDRCSWAVATRRGLLGLAIVLAGCATAPELETAKQIPELMAAFDVDGLAVAAVSGDEVLTLDPGNANAATMVGKIEKAAGFSPASCEIGLYGTSAPFVVVTSRNDNYRYSFSDGRRGDIAGDGDVECGNNAVRVSGKQILKRQAVSVTDTQFVSNGVTLAGQLLEPADANAETALVVLAHGSEPLGWIGAVAYPYHFVGRGVSVFVYDKRGTGRSGGEYSQNFPELSDDLVAASGEAKRLARDRFGRFGLFGFSQGGWIAPMAAQRAEADFIGIGYGLVVDILEEDASQVALELREAGYGDEVIQKAKEITDITARLAVSGYTDGLEDLDDVRRRYGNEPWFPIIRGGFTGVILGLPTTQLRNEGIPMFDRLRVDWSIKPMEVLRTVEVPQLWVLAADDREAPVATTLDRLRILRGEGKDISIVMYPDTDHGMREFVQSEDGTREYTRVVDTFYDLIADWAKGLLDENYAESVRL